MTARTLALAAFLAGCAGEKGAPAPADPPPAGTSSISGSESGSVSGSASASGPVAAAAAATAIPRASRQLVLATVDDWRDVTATVARYERTDHGWTRVGDPWPAVVGIGGSAWGRGLHGDGAPPGQDGPLKIEGDGKSPAGAFALGAAFGYADDPPPGTRAPYIKVGPTWRCVDDGASRHYNRVLDTAGLDEDWSSAEIMRRRDDLYRWGLLVEHNPTNAPGAGSCIFLHVWRDAESGTAGCTAVERPNMEALLTWLDPAARPVFVLLPAAERAALAGAWALPAD